MEFATTKEKGMVWVISQTETLESERMHKYVNFYGRIAKNILDLDVTFNCISSCVKEDLARVRCLMNNAGVKTLVVPSLGHMNMSRDEFKAFVSMVDDLKVKVYGADDSRYYDLHQRLTEDEIAAARALPRPYQIYRHFKGGIYQILNIAKHTETGEEMVVYQAMYGDFQVYVRPLSMFGSMVDKEKYPDVEQMYRFERVEELE